MGPSQQSLTDVRRTYYLFQMPRWDRRLRIVLDWTIAFSFRPDITRVDLRVEREQVSSAPFGGEVLGVVGNKDLECLMGSITHI